jgi:sulfonate transport system substrate-binding protein
LAGEIDFQNGIGDLPLLNGWRSGVDTILLAQTGGLGEHVGIMVSNDSGIESIEALKGKNVGVYVGTTFHKSALGILSDHGLSAGDVNFVNIDSTADGIAALESGELDAYYMPNTYYTDYAEENDIGYILEDSTAYPTFGYFVGTADFVSTYPEETKALLKALQRAADYINADKEAAAKLISDFLGTEFDSAYSVITYHNVEVELTDAAISNLYNAENFLNDAGAVETRLTEDEINAHIDYSYYESAVGDEN